MRLFISILRLKPWATLYHCVMSFSGGADRQPVDLIAQETRFTDPSHVTLTFRRVTEVAGEWFGAAVA